MSLESIDKHQKDCFFLCESEVAQSCPTLRDPMTHKWSSISDTHQNQLAKMPKLHLMPQTVLNIRYTSELTSKNAQIALTNDPQWQRDTRTN